MVTLIARFNRPQNVTPPKFDGKVFTFPYSTIEKQYIDTPRQSSQIVHGRISVEISGSVAEPWGLSGVDLVKVLFQFAKEHLTSLLENSSNVAGDRKVVINSYTNPGKCPFDVNLIEEPEGAVLSISVNRPIGFV